MELSIGRDHQRVRIMHHATRRSTHSQFPGQDTTCAQIDRHGGQRDVRQLVQEALALSRVDGGEGVEVEPARRLLNHGENNE